MVCPRPGCARPMALDVRFESDAISYGVNKRQWVDYCGHRYTESYDRGFKELNATRAHEPRRCRQCGRMIVNVTHETQAMHPGCAMALSKVGRRSLLMRSVQPRTCRSCGKTFRPKHWSNAARAIHCAKCKKLPRCQVCGNYHRADGRHFKHSTYQWVGGGKRGRMIPAKALV